MLISGQDLLAGITLADLEELIDTNPSLRGYMHGYLAELHLQRILLQTPGVTFVEKIPDRSPAKGDFRVIYQGDTLTIEVKSLSSHALKEDYLNGGWNGKVSIKGTDSKIINEEGDMTTCLVRGEFDILAICTFSLTKTWDFKFIANKYLPSSTLYADRLSTTLTLNTINTPKLTDDVLEVFSEFIASSN